MSARVQDPQKFVRHASTIAAYYGFRPLVDVNPELFKQRIGRSAPSFISGAMLCAESARQTPTLAYWATPAVSHHPKEVSAREAAEFSLQVSGCAQSTAEIVIIKTLCTILNDWGAPVARIRVNTFGDRDSRERFARELGAFLRRKLSGPTDGLDEEERTVILSEPTHAYHSRSPVVLEVLQEAPRPLYFLSERSRSHFKEFLDQLEQLGLPYELDDLLAGDEREPRVLFRLDLSNEESGFVLGNHGGRFDEMIARLAGRRDATAVNASVYFRKKGASASTFKTGADFRPKMYFIQLGLRAKLCGLSVVDVLREAQIPVGQTFDTTKLSPQLQAATQAGVPYVLIMGEREAIDQTVIIRSMRNSSQQIVGLQSLPKVLKSLRM